MIDATIFALLNVPAVTAIIGTDPARVYGNGMAPQNAPLPHVTWQVIAGVPEAILDAPGIDNYRVQVDCWAVDAATRSTLALAVRDAMERDGANVMVSENGHSVDPDTRQYRWSADFSLWVPRA